MRTTWRFRPIVPMTAAIAFGLTGFIGVAACRRPEAASATARTERQDPYALMTREFFAHPHQFQIARARGAEAAVRRTLPNATLTFEEQAVVTNLGDALRAIVAYRGEMPAPDGGTLSVDAELRQYFHPRGAVVVEAACFNAGSSCGVPRALIDRTDAIVLQHLPDEGVSSLLPPDAVCEASPMPMVSHVNRVTVCRLGPDVRLSVMRLSVDQTLAEFR